MELNSVKIGNNTASKPLFSLNNNKLTSIDASGIQDAGLVVGKDVHVINVETCDLPAFYNPLIPGLRQNFHSVGTVLSKYIIKLIEGEDPKKLQYIEKATFYPRDEK